MAIQTILGTDVVKTTGLTKLNANFSDLDTRKANLSGADFTGNVKIATKLGVGGVTPTSIAHIWQNDTEVGSGGGLTIEQVGTGDALLQFLLTGVRRWVVGVDNSDSDKFKISPSADLSNGEFTIDTNGNVGIGTTSPNEKLVVDGKIKITNGGQNPMYLEGYANSASASSTLTSAPNSTFLLGGGSTSSFYVYWKDASGNKYYATLSGTTLT